MLLKLLILVPCNCKQLSNLYYSKLLLDQNGYLPLPYHKLEVISKGLKVPTVVTRKDINDIH